MDSGQLLRLAVSADDAEMTRTRRLMLGVAGCMLHEKFEDLKPPPILDLVKMSGVSNVSVKNALKWARGNGILEQDKAGGRYHFTADYQAQAKEVLEGALETQMDIIAIWAFLSKTDLEEVAKKLGDRIESLESGSW